LNVETSPTQSHSPTLPARDSNVENVETSPTQSHSPALPAQDSNVERTPRQSNTLAIPAHDSNVETTLKQSSSTLNFPEVDKMEHSEPPLKYTEESQNMFGPSTDTFDSYTTNSRSQYSDSGWSTGKSSDVLGQYSDDDPGPAQSTEPNIVQSIPPITTRSNLEKEDSDLSTVPYESWFTGKSSNVLDQDTDDDSGSAQSTEPNTVQRTPPPATRSNLEKEDSDLPTVLHEPVEIFQDSGTIAFVVPHNGYEPKMKIFFKSPANGQTMLVYVPEGLVPGDVFDIKYA